MHVEVRPVRQQRVRHLRLAVVVGEEQRGRAVLILGGEERRIGAQHLPDALAVATLHGRQEFVRHRALRA
jgi:hypothetical protein